MEMAKHVKELQIFWKENFENKIMIDYSYMRPQKAEDLMMRYKDISHYSGNLSVEMYDNAVALPTSERAWGSGTRK